MNHGDGSTRTPWWLERGDAICCDCHDAFHPEATVRCQGCDACVCATCVVETRGVGEGVSVVCHACAEASG